MRLNDLWQCHTCTCPLGSAQARTFRITGTTVALLEAEVAGMDIAALQVCAIAWEALHTAMYWAQRSPHGPPPKWLRQAQALHGHIISATPWPTAPLALPWPTDPPPTWSCEYHAEPVWALRPRVECCRPFGVELQCSHAGRSEFVYFFSQLC